MGYTALAEVCKSGSIHISSGTPMSRMVVLIFILLLLGGGVYYLSTLPKEVPVKTVTVDVAPGGNAQ